MISLESELYRIMGNINANIKAQPLFLGGVSGSGGGLGGPPGGFVGFLPQTQIAYDSTEAANYGFVASGTSLIDNLNHMRARLQTLETSSSGTGGGGHTILNPSGIAMIQRTNLEFTGTGVTLSDNGITTIVTISGGGGSGSVTGPATSTDGHIAVFNGTTGKIIKDGGAVVSTVENPTFYIGGALIVASGVGPTIVVGNTSTITEVYAYVNTTGSAGSTIIDIHKNGTTIFTTQANRPTIAHNASNKVVAIPNITSLVDGDILTLDIDSIATGASSLTVVVVIQAVTGSTGTGNVVGPVSVTDGHLAMFDGTTGKLLKDGGAPEKAVAIKYSINNDGQTIPGPYIYTTVNFDTMTYDTYSAVTTGTGWKFTCPVGKSGYYTITCWMLLGGGFTTGDCGWLAILKNGAAYSYPERTYNISPDGYIHLHGGDIIPLNDGDTISIQIFHNKSSTMPIYNLAGQYNSIAIGRLGGSL